MKDIRRLWFGSFLPSPATMLCHQQKLPERRSIWINIQGRLENGEQVKEVLKYGGRCDGGHDLQV